MPKINDIDVFKLTSVQDKMGTLYYRAKEDLTYVYIGNEKFLIEAGSMAYALPGELPLADKFQGFSFKTDVSMEGKIIIWQMDEHYMVLFVTAMFTDSDPDALNTVILLKAGNALADLEK